MDVWRMTTEKGRAASSYVVIGVAYTLEGSRWIFITITDMIISRPPFTIQQREPPSYSPQLGITSKWSHT